MDNANKIIDSKTTHKEVVLFLGDDLKKNNNENFGKYDLVEEYAKTARNKQPFVWILLALCFIFVGAGTFTTVMLVANSNHKIAINIDSFDDLNLRSLLNSAGRVKSLYEKAIKNKKNLEENRDDELAQAEQKKANDLFTLKSVSSVTSKESLKSGQKKIEEAFQLTVQKINEDYNEKIAKAEEEISHYKDQVDSYDKNKLSKAEGEEAVLDSTKQLHDLEMRSQAESYEAKIKQLRQQLVDQQIKAAEEQKKAVDQVRQTYQAKINLLDPKAREQSSEQNSIILDTGIKNKASSSKVWKNVEELLFREEDYLNSSSSKGFIEAVKESGRELK